MSKTTYTIEVQQGDWGPIIDRFTIDLDDELNSKEQTRLIHEKMRKRLEEKKRQLQ